eukprot:TRINITY_DN105721_c0_g1_i1.p1 TRINITY_DN105721_c0_g1~~TRINITY_DN105721_c0_g1_i1.p1  ORF type:complete len:429 (-),score=107.06 TRINITY_DN105721_c0_g1_i1:195-1481(-)
MAFHNMGPTKEAFMPWAGSAFEPEYEAASSAPSTFVEVTVLLHGVNQRTRTLSVPSNLTCADLKGHLAVEGVVSTCGGLEVSLEEGAEALDDAAAVQLVEGQVVHLRQAASLVSITALATGGGTMVEDEVYELVVPGETTGLLLRMAIEQATAGALRPAAVFMAEPGSEEAARAVADEETITLQDEQAVIVHREAVVHEPAPPAAPEAPAVPAAPASKGFFGTLKARLTGSKATRRQGPPTSVCVRSAANLKVKSGVLSCTSKQPWASCAVFDVPDPSFFELGVKLLADAPSAEADGLAGRWMLGLVPVVASESVKTDAERRQLLDKGYFVTVCHGHPAKVHAPEMARGTCGEDCFALPGELRKGQTLTLTWAAQGATISVQVDDYDAVILPYSPGGLEEVRPCLVFGGKPAEVEVLQLKPGQEWGGA